MEWRPVVGFEVYEVSNQGDVRNAKTGNVLKCRADKKGYLRVNFRRDGKLYEKLVHRVVAMAFIPNPDGKPIIDHKNTIPSDNRVENLRWSTCKENNNNPLTRKHNSEAKSGSNHPLYGKKHKTETILKMIEMSNKTPVEQYSKHGELIGTWDSMTDAEKATGIFHSNISKCCNGERKTAGGFIWKLKGA